MAGGLLVRVDLDWSGPGHYDPERSLPCRICATNTKMRDNQGTACHVSCAEGEIAREIGAGQALIADERIPTTTGQEAAR